MATVKQFEDLGVWQDARQLVRAISPRLATFIRYLESYPSNSRVRKPGKR